MTGKKEIVFIPGTPETDASKLLIDGVECVTINYDESKVGVEGVDYTLPSPLRFVDGRAVATAADWQERRREILSIFEREVYGKMPERPPTLKAELLAERDRPEFSMVERRYRVAFRADGTGPVIDWIVFVPAGSKRPVPVFVHLNYNGCDQIATGNTNHFPIPMAELSARGLGLMSAHYLQVTSDGPGKPGEPFDGVFEVWGGRDPGRADATGSLMAWAWALCRGVDLAGQIPEFDAARCAVIGSSRLGKAALLAAAFDDRIPVCVANQTGAVGVQLMKRNYGESLAWQERMMPWWSCPGLWKWVGREREMPFDQHMLLSCVAPRALLLECYHKRWFDPRGEFLSAKAASPVWEFLTGRGLGLDDWPEPYDVSAVHPPFGYERRIGTHGIDAFDWKCALDFTESAFAQGAKPGAGK